MIRPGTPSLSLTDAVDKSAPLFAEHFKLHPRDIDRLTVEEFDALVGLYNRRVKEAEDASKQDRR